MRAAIVAAAIALLCAGCATNSGSVAVPGQTSITISRAIIGAATVPANIELNGVRIASLPVGGSYTNATPPGPTTLTVSGWSAPGQSSVSFTAEPGKSYHFAIAARRPTILTLATDVLPGAPSDGPFTITAE